MSAPLTAALQAGMRAATEREGWPATALAPIDWQPGRAKRGDIATPVAFAIAQRLGRPAPEVARAIARETRLTDATIEAAGGFLNVTLGDAFCRQALATTPPAPVAGTPRTLRVALGDGALGLGDAQRAVLAASLASLLTRSEAPTRLVLAGPGSARPRLETLGVRADAWEDVTHSKPQAQLEGERLDWGAIVGETPDWDALLAECGPDALHAALLVAPGQPVRPAPLRETLDEPLYYLRYSRARAHSLLRLPTPQGTAATPDAARTLMVALALHADRLAAAATARAPWRLWGVLAEIAQALHAFVRACPPAASAWQGYAALIGAAERVLEHGLEALMFLSAPADI